MTQLYRLLEDCVFYGPTLPPGSDAEARKHHMKAGTLVRRYDGDDGFPWCRLAVVAMPEWTRWEDITKRVRALSPLEQLAEQAE